MGPAFGGQRMSKYHGIIVVVVESAVVYSIAVALFLGFFLADTGVGSILALTNPQILVRILCDANSILSYIFGSPYT